MTQPQPRSLSESEYSHDYMRDAFGGLKVDVNSATREELLHVPNICEALADRIIENRPLRTWEDLESLFRVDGIRMQHAKDYLTLGGRR